MITLGEKAVQDSSFYSFIHQKAEELSFKPLVENATPIDNKSDLDFSSNAWKVIKNGAHDHHETIPETDTQITSLNDDLEFVFNNLKQQVVNDLSTQLDTEVNKFCERYNG